MEATPEGRAIAAATRDAAKRKHDEVVKEDKLVPVKKKKQPKGTSTHLVAIPEGYSEAESELDVAVHGELSLGLLFAVGAVFSLVQDHAACTALPAFVVVCTGQLKPAVRAGTLHEPVYNGLAAKEYLFELDPFQKTSVACLVSWHHNQ